MFWGDVPPLKLLSSLMLALKVFSIFRCAGVQWRRSTTPLFMMRSATVVIGAEFLLWCYPEWYEHQLWIVHVYIFVCLFVFVCACVRMLVARAVLQTPLDRINPWYKSLVEVSAPPSLPFPCPLLIQTVPGSFPGSSSSSSSSPHLHPCISRPRCGLRASHPKSFAHLRGSRVCLFCLTKINLKYQIFRFS